MTQRISATPENRNSELGSLTERRQNQAIVKVRTEIAQLNSDDRHWQEALLLLSCSILLTVAALFMYLSTLVDSDDLQRVRIFITATACVLAWCSYFRARKGIVAMEGSIAANFILSAATVWSTIYGFWFVIIVLVRVVEAYKQ
jgi:hypothetical protein